MARFTVSLPKELDTMVTKEANTSMIHGKNKSSVVRQALDEYFSRKRTSGACVASKKSKPR